MIEDGTLDLVQVMQPFGVCACNVEAMEHVDVQRVEQTRFTAEQRRDGQPL